MRIPSIKLTTLGALLSLFFVAGCGQSGGGAGAEDDSPEANAFRYRQAVMRIAANKMALLGNMARGDAPVDDAAFRKAAADLAVVAGMVEEGFMPEGAVAGSATLPETWSNWSDFTQKAGELESAAAALAAATASGGFQAGQAMVQSTAGTCGGCHRAYRQRDEE
jgi:cytochrome c556